MEYSLSSSERPILPVCYRGYCIVFRSKWRRKYIENGNLVKTKMETVPFSQSFKDDRMTTWRFLRYSMQFSEHFNGKKVLLRMSNYRDLHITFVIFRCFISFISCMSRGGNADRRVFGCPRMKRGAPDLPCHSGSRLARLMKPANKSISLVAKRCQV